MVRMLKPRLGTLGPRIAPVEPAPGDRGGRYGQGRGGRPWRRKRDRILERDGYLCQQCKREGQLTLATEVDHIEPLFLGGTDDDANLESICGPHHAKKTAAEIALARQGTVTRAAREGRG